MTILLIAAFTVGMFAGAVLLGFGILGIAIWLEHEDAKKFARYQ